MKNIIFLAFLVSIVIIACTKPMDEVVILPVENDIEVVDSTEATIVMPPCDCFADVDQSQSFNGVWNLTFVDQGFGGYYTFETGYNVWFFDDQDSSVVVCNVTDKGPVSGDYFFTIDSEDQFFLLDSIGNSVFIACCEMGKDFNFTEDGFYFHDEEGFDEPNFFYERNE